MKTKAARSSKLSGRRKAAIALGTLAAAVALVVAVYFGLTLNSPPAQWCSYDCFDWFIDEHQDIEGHTGEEIVGAVSYQQANAILRGIAFSAGELCDHVTYENITPHDDEDEYFSFSSSYEVCLYPSCEENTYAKVEITPEGRLHSITYCVELDKDLDANEAVDAAEDELLALVDIVSQSSFISTYYPYALELTSFSENVTETVRQQGLERVGEVADLHSGTYELSSAYHNGHSVLERLTGQAVATLSISMEI